MRTECHRQLVMLTYPRIDFKDNYACTWLPYSILYIADALRTQGLVDVLVYDANVPQSRSFESVVRENAERLLAVGFSIMTGGQQIESALAMAKTVQENAPHAVRMFGGPHVNVLPDQTCRHPLVDVATVGPGQYVVPPVIEALLAGKPLGGLPDVWMKNARGEAVAPTARLSQWNADGLHHWEAVDAAPYIKDDELLGSRVLNYISSFGCCYCCRFCYEQQYGRRYRAIPADTVIKDLDGLTSQYALSGIKFYDADFFVNRSRAKDIYVHLGGTIAWAASIHPNDVLCMVGQDHDAMMKMADAGCRRLLMGVESGDARVLSEIVNKRTTPTKIFEAAKAIDRAGIRGAYTFILGFPGETADEKRRTRDFAMEIASLPSSPEVRFHGYAPYPGTPMFTDALTDGFSVPSSLEEWSKFDYYSMKTPWLSDEDEYFIQQWSKVTGRRLIERRQKKEAA